MAKTLIESHPGILNGKPVVAGTRISVELILDRLAAGETPVQIRQAFPHLPEGAIESALAYAAAVMRNESIIPVQLQPA
jgi:uncharacterized protein (DUF433 family)